eukprot:365981-Chlamydomonas_euryale.AAC.17
MISCLCFPFCTADVAAPATASAILQRIPWRRCAAILASLRAEKKPSSPRRAPPPSCRAAPALAPLRHDACGRRTRQGFAAGDARRA